jgi:hypothetical protein
MADQPITAPREDEPNPFAPPRSDLNDRWGMSDPEAEALRRAHVQEESYVKALAIVNFAYFLLFGAMAANYAWILISHLRGRTNAPWIIRPGFVALQVIIYGMPILALGAACGFFMRKRWTLRFEFLLALCLFLDWALEPLIRSNPLPMLEFFAQTVMLLAVASPMLSVLDLKGSLIFDAEYTHAIESTPHIKVRPKLPLELKLIMGGFVVVFLVLLGFSTA